MVWSCYHHPFKIEKEDEKWVVYRMYWGCCPREDCLGYFSSIEKAKKCIEKEVKRKHFHLYQFYQRSGTELSKEEFIQWCCGDLEYKRPYDEERERFIEECKKRLEEQQS